MKSWSTSATISSRTRRPGRTLGVVAMSRGSLCPRCGGSEFEQIDERESRCADCGLGRTIVPPVAAVETSPEAHEANERVRVLMDQFTGPPPPFDDASFLPYGLDDRWTGLKVARWFGAL